jgi:hypothetical protein
VKLELEDDLGPGGPFPGPQSDQIYRTEGYSKRCAQENGVHDCASRDARL